MQPVHLAQFCFESTVVCSKRSLYEVSTHVLSDIVGCSEGRRYMWAIRKELGRSFTRWKFRDTHVVVASNPTPSDRRTPLPLTPEPLETKYITTLSRNKHRQATEPSNVPRTLRSLSPLHDAGMHNIGANTSSNRHNSVFLRPEDLPVGDTC